MPTWRFLQRYADAVPPAATLDRPRFPKEQVLSAANAIKELLGASVRNFEIAGSIRRGAADTKDLDIVVTGDPQQALYLLKQAKTAVKAAGASKIQFEYKGIPVDLIFAPTGLFGAFMLSWTGPRELNVMMRAKAKNMGYVLNDSGLYAANGEPVATNERDIFTALHLPYLEPNQRNDFKVLFKKAP